MLLPFLSIACCINLKRVVPFSDTLHKARDHKMLCVTEKKNSESMLTKTVKKIVSSSPKTETSFGFFAFLQIDLKKQHKQLYFRLS